VAKELQDPVTREYCPVFAPKAKTPVQVDALVISLSKYAQRSKE
jgi:hypothetical protein